MQLQCISSVRKQSFVIKLPFFVLGCLSNQPINQLQRFVLEVEFFIVNSVVRCTFYNIAAMGGGGGGGGT